jgi:hypothetical protein
MRSIRTQLIVLFTAIAFIAAGCPEKKGPGQRAGEKFDKEMKQTGKEMKKEGERIEHEYDAD